MISKELTKRTFTSIVLFALLTLMYFYSYILITSLIIISLIAWIEFYGLISKIFIKDNFSDKLLRFICKSFSLLYLSLFTLIALIINSKNSILEIFIIYSLLVSISSDIGGFVFGTIFKGKKLTKISPKKTISGSIGSFIFSLSLIPFFFQNLINYNILSLLIITLLISLTSQIGDLFISLLKRKAKVKDTSDLLPGHGGVLDRIDGILFSVPMGFLLLKLF
jgi:phosphatidate cytidylyltransferase